MPDTNEVDAVALWIEEAEREAIDLRNLLRVDGHEQAHSMASSLRATLQALKEQCNAEADTGFSSGVAGGYTAPMPIQETPFMISGQWLSEQQAQRNHSQSLKRLAERGGVSPREALALMTESDWNEYRDISEVEALNRILLLRRQWIGESAV